MGRAVSASNEPGDELGGAFEIPARPHRVTLNVVEQATDRGEVGLRRSRVGEEHVRHEAQRRWYRLRPEPLAEIDSWLAPYRQFWAERLDALEDHLDAMPAEPADAAQEGPRP